MLDCFAAKMIVGTILGTLSGLGVGGGSLLMLWLTLVAGVETATARLINLMNFLPAAGISLLLYRKCPTSKEKLVPAVFTGVVCAIILSIASTFIDTDQFRKPFGVLLVLIALKEIRFRKKTPG